MPMTQRVDSKSGTELALKEPLTPPAAPDTSSVYAVLRDWRECVGIKTFEELTRVTSNSIYARRAHGLTYSFGELITIGERAGLIPPGGSFEDRWNNPETRRVRATVLRESKSRGRFIPGTELSMVCELVGVKWTERELWKLGLPEFTKLTAHNLVSYLPTPWQNCAPFREALIQRGAPRQLLAEIEVRWSRELERQKPATTAMDILLDWQRGQGIQLRDLAEIAAGSSRSHELVWGVLHGKDAPFQVPFGRIACVLASSTSDLNRALLVKSEEHAAYLARIAARPDPIRTEGVLWGLKGEDLEKVISSQEDKLSTSSAVKHIRGHGMAAAKGVLGEWVASRTHRPFHEVFKKVVSSLDGEVHEGIDTVHVSYDTFHEFLRGHQVPTFKAFEVLARHGLSEVTGRRSIEWLEAAATFARGKWSSPLAQALWVAHHRGYDTEGEFIRCEGLPKQATYNVMRRVRDGELVSQTELQLVSSRLREKNWIAPLYLTRLLEGSTVVAAAAETIRRINLLGDVDLRNKAQRVTSQATKPEIHQALFDSNLSHEGLSDLYIRKAKLVARSTNGPIPCAEMESLENALAALMLILPGITKVELEEAIGKV